VLAFRLAERINELLIDTQKSWFIKGVLAARERPDESPEELAGQEGLSQLPKEAPRVRAICKDES